VWCFSKWNTPKIGYVKSPIIIQEYKEMQDAQKKFEEEVKVVQMNSDTLKRRYERLLSMEGSVNNKERKEWLHRLEIAQEEFGKYNHQASEQIENRKNEMSQNVLMRINDYIQNYGKENHYKLILGTTSEGSILYGEEGDDLTQVILNKLNEAYQKSKKNEKE
jgi:outer membrane protein